MPIRIRRAAVNKGLITVLALTCVVAVGVWIYRATRPIDYAGPVGTEMNLVCTSCGDVKVPSDKIDYKGRDFKCPKCGQYTAHLPGPTDMVETPP